MLQMNLINLYNKLRINAGRTGDMLKYNALKALQAEVQKAMFSSDFAFVQSVYEKVWELI